VPRVVDVKTVRSWFNSTLASRGFTVVDGCRERAGDGVQWLVGLDTSPVGRRMDVVVGLNLSGLAPRARARDCPISVNLANFPRLDPRTIAALFELRSTIEDDEREAGVRAALTTVADYVDGHMSINSLRSAYLEGDLKSALIFKDARALLESSWSGP
jgi:hypothetical protein